MFVSFGKSGRTWVRVMVSRVYQQKHALAEGSLLEFDNFHRASPEIPRVLFTHDNYLRDFTGDGASKAAFRDKRVILLVRHPADVAVSMFHQCKHRMRPHKALLNGYPPSGDDVTPYEFLMRPCGLDKVIRFMNEWAAQIDALDQVLVVRYEDLRDDTAAELARMMRLLGVDASAAEIEQAVEYGAFENMRKRESQSQSSSDRLSATDLSNPNSFKTRRGKVGGYQDDFTPAELEVIERRINDTLHERFGYRARERAYGK
ncbi:MAG: sulfotransferase domain-containing protein [Pseudomonadales bacterium]